MVSKSTQHRIIIASIIIVCFILLNLISLKAKLFDVSLKTQEEVETLNIKSELVKFSVFSSEYKQHTAEICSHKFNKFNWESIIQNNYTLFVSCETFEGYIEFLGVLSETPDFVVKTILEKVFDYLTWYTITGITYDGTIAKIYPRSNYAPTNIFDLSKKLNRVGSSCLSQAKQISQNFGFVHIQIFNSAFIDTTKSFICNLRKFDNELENTLFIATDQIAFDAIDSFSSNDYRICLEDYKQTDTLIYGKKQYFEFITWRSHFLLSLLQENITFFLTESDAVWLDSFFAHLFKTLEQNPDALVFLGNNRPLHGKHLNGGFQYVKSDPVTVAVWQALLKWQTRNKHNEQFELDKLYYRFAKNETVFFDDKVVSSGTWFQKRVLRRPTNIVILNNWIKGITQKTNRFQSWGFWFFDDSSDECISPIPLKDYNVIEKLCNVELC